MQVNQAPDTGKMYRSRAADFRRFLRNFLSGPVEKVAMGIIVAAVLISIFAPLVIQNYSEIDPLSRMQPPSAAHLFGTDHLGRDVFARSMVGTRNSLIIGFSVAILATLIGGALGLIAGFMKIGDRLIMRLMDGLMAIPSVLLAIALVALMGSSILTIIIAITVPETPRMARIVRSVVVSLKEMPFIDAAVTMGTPEWKILLRHLLPNTVGALSVQATATCASAIITEAILSFLGAGTPPDIPSWGGIIAESRVFFQISPWAIAFPGLMLSLLVLAVNVLGDRMREVLDPRLSRRMA